MRRAALLAVAGVLGCGGGASIPVGPLTVTPVNYNPNAAPLGHVAAVADLGDSAMVFSDSGMSVLVAGALTATDASVAAWRSAGVIPAADGAGQWVVGVDQKGAVYTVDANSQLESVSDRFGLLGSAVHDAAGLGAAQAAFRLDGAVAIADGQHVTTYPLRLDSLAGYGGRVAGVAGDAVQVFDGRTGQATAYPLPGAVFAAFDETGAMVAATAHALYREDNGALDPLLDLAGQTVHGLAGGGTGVWVAIDGELGLLAGGAMGESSGAGLPADATLTASSSGDVWALSQGALTRFSAAPAGDQTLWQQDCLPVFTRVCSQCHLPGGTANIDLSYYGAWIARRKLIGQRVFDKLPTPMPPTSASVILTDADLAALRAWIYAPGT